MRQLFLGGSAHEQVLPGDNILVELNEPVSGYGFAYKLRYGRAVGYPRHRPLIPAPASLARKPR
jgi:hypothetical protein